MRKISLAWTQMLTPMNSPQNLPMIEPTTLVTEPGLTMAELAILAKEQDMLVKAPQAMLVTAARITMTDLDTPVNEQLLVVIKQSLVAIV